MKSPQLIPKQLGYDFHRFFGTYPTSFWDIYTGFDIIKFDDYIAPSEDQSLEEYILERHGEQAVSIIKRLLNI